MIHFHATVCRRPLMWHNFPNRFFCSRLCFHFCCVENFCRVWKKSVGAILHFATAKEKTKLISSFFLSFLQDLVKSHLMFAVREEVEVLKEKIAELMDRINQLEVENTILKANASQETLSQLTTAATIVSPVQTSPAQQQQPQSSPALSKINIDASVLQAAANMTSQTQPSTQNPPQQPQQQQQQNPSTAS